MDKGAHFYKCDFQVHTPETLHHGSVQTFEYRSVQRNPEHQ